MIEHNLIIINVMKEHTALIFQVPCIYSHNQKVLIVNLIINSSTTLRWTLAAFSVSYSYTQSVRILQSLARPLPTHRITQMQNKCTQVYEYTPRVRFEPTTPVFER
jgi:hypothetical protein